MDNSAQQIARDTPVPHCPECTAEPVDIKAFFGSDWNSDMGDWMLEHNPIYYLCLQCGTEWSDGGNNDF